MGVLSLPFFCFAPDARSNRASVTMNKTIVSTKVLKRFCELLLQQEDKIGYFSLCGKRDKNSLSVENYPINIYAIIQNDFVTSIATKKINELDDILGLLSEQPITISFNINYISIETILI